MALHRSVTEGQIHIVYNYSFADTTARDAAGSYTNADIGKVALLESDNTLWLLVSTTPTWVSISGAFPGQLDGYASDTTVQEHYAALSQAIETIRKDLDGYSTTDQEHYVQLSAALESVIKDLDGYAIRTIEDQRWIDTSEQLFNVRAVLDGYRDTESEHYTWTSEAIGHLLVSVDGYADKQTEIEHYNQLAEAIGHLRTAADGYGQGGTEAEHWNQQSQINQSVLQALDGYAIRSIEDQRWIDESDQIQSVRNALDGYAILTTEDQRWIDTSEQIQGIRDVLDADAYVDALTFEENKNAQLQVNQSVLSSLDGYALLAIEDQRWVDSSQQLQDIRDTLDGYITAATAGVSETTFSENKNYWDESIGHLRVSADGYADKQTEIEHYNQLSEAIEHLRTAADGYGGGSTETEHYNQQQQINQSVLQALDGYALLTTEDQRWIDTSEQIQGIRDVLDADAYVDALTFEENKNAQLQVNQFVLSSLDGYAIKTTEDQRWIDSSQQLQDLRDAADGYALKSTEDQRWIDTSEQLQGLRDASDGYALRSVEDQRWIDTSEQIQGIRDVLDADAYVDALTFEENKNAQYQVNQLVVQALDGYQTQITGLDGTVEENKTAHAEAIHQILVSLDGYTTAVQSGVSEQTFGENKDAWNEINHQILVALDAYVAADAYIAGNIIASTDNVHKLGDPLYRWKSIYAGGDGVHVKSDIFEDTELVTVQDAYIDHVGYINTSIGDGTSATSADPSTGTAATVSIVRGGLWWKDKIFFTDSVVIREFDPNTNIVQRVWGDGGFTDQTTGAILTNDTGDAQDCCVLSNGDVIMCDNFYDRIKLGVRGGSVSNYAGTGINGNTGDDAAATLATFTSVVSVCADASDNVYICDSGANRIRKVSGGTITHFAGSTDGSSGNTGDDGAAASCKLSAPNLIRFNNDYTYMYVADGGNHRVRRINMGTNVITHFAGNSGGSSGDGADGTDAASSALNQPTCCTFDGYGNVYIADVGNEKIKRVTSQGIISTVCGTSAGFSGDGGLAYSAQVSFAGNRPFIAMPPTGNTLWLSDLGNDRIRKISFDFNALDQQTKGAGAVFRDYHIAVGEDTHNFIIRDGYENDPETLMAIDADDGYVGFGTDNPTAALDLQNIGGSALQFVEAGTTGGPTGVGWITIKIGGVEMYLRAFSTK